MVKTFIDTNIFLYAYDASAGFKSHIAIRQLEELAGGKWGYISTQIASEFVKNLVQKAHYSPL